MLSTRSAPSCTSLNRCHGDGVTPGIIQTPIIVGRDPEIAAPRPPDIPGILLDVFSLVRLRTEYAKMLRHCFGRLTAAEETYIPDSQRHKVYRNARHLHADLRVGDCAGHRHSPAFCR